jgi:hypothetical protein
VRQERATYSFDSRADRTFQDQLRRSRYLHPVRHQRDVEHHRMPRPTIKRTFEGGDELKAGYDLRIDDNRYWTGRARRFARAR